MSPMPGVSAPSAQDLIYARTRDPSQLTPDVAYLASRDTTQLLNDVGMSPIDVVTAANAPYNPLVAPPLDPRLAMPGYGGDAPPIGGPPPAMLLNAPNLVPSTLNPSPAGAPPSVAPSMINFGPIGGVLGGIVGAIAGGPAGAVTGASIGNTLGSVASGTSTSSSSPFGFGPPTTTVGGGGIFNPMSPGGVMPALLGGVPNPPTIPGTTLIYERNAAGAIIGRAEVINAAGKIIGTWLYHRAKKYWTFRPGRYTRRMNVMNPHALSRANRRVTGFAHHARGIMKHLGYHISTTRHVKKTVRRKRR